MAEQQEPVRRRVALKVIKLGMDTKQVIARFEAERQALALMDHPNIAKVLDAGATETGRPYFVMELVKGVPITRYCDENNLLTVTRLGLFVQVCQAIQHAHQKGIIHRDIKPSNILVADHDGMPVPKIIDFGIAKATTDQRLTDKTLFTAFEQFIGTPAYMSPEQAKLSGLDIDTRSDIYSLGVLLYELLTGKTPFEGKRLLEAGLDEIRRIIREEEPMRPSTRLHTLDAAEQTTVAKHRQSDAPKLVHLIRGDLDWIVMKCLEKDRGRRYETANGLAKDVQRHLQNEPVTACPPGNVYRFQKMMRRNKLAFGAAATVGVSLILGLAISSLLFVREREARASEATMREQAEAAGKQALAEAARAEAASVEAKASELKAKEKEREAKATLSSSEFMQGGRLLAEGHARDAVAYLARSLSDNPANEAAATRLATLLVSHAWMVPAVLLQPNKVLAFAEFSPDGNRLVTVSEDGVAQVWDTRSAQPLTAPLKNSGRVHLAHFSPDGQRIVTASRGMTARVWDAQSGLPLTEPLKNEAPESSAQFSPDGKRIVTASWDKTVRVWDAQTGQPLTEALTTGAHAYSAQFSPDGKRIVTASTDMTARVWDAQNGQPLTAPLQHSSQVLFAQFSPDGKRIVTASGTVVQLWDAQTSQPLGTPLAHSAQVRFAQFTYDGKRIVTTAGTTAQAWDAQSGRPLTAPLKHSALVYSAQYSPDGKLIYTASADGARAWKVQNAQLPRTGVVKLNGGNLLSARFSPDGMRIVTISGAGAQIWDAQSGGSLSAPLKRGDILMSAQFSPDGKRVVTAEGTMAQVWDAQSGQPLGKPLQYLGPVVAAQFSPDGKKIVTAAPDAARVWDAETGQALTEPLRHDGAVFSAQFSPDGKRILTGSNDGTARQWDAQTGQPLSARLRNVGPVSSAGYSPDGKWIVTTSDTAARIWDARNGQPLTEPLEHGSYLSSAQFSPDGKWVLTASGATARVWDAQSGQPLTEPLQFGSELVAAQFSPDGRRIFTVSPAGSVRLWDIAPLQDKHPVWLLQLVEAVSGQILNKQGLLELTRLNCAAALEEIRQQLSRQPENDDWAIWGRWFLADPFTRTISPFSKQTVPNYIQDRIKEKAVNSLDEAELLAGDNESLLTRIAQARGALQETARSHTLTRDADALLAQGKLAEAETKYSEALDLSRDLNGREHPDTINAMRALADFYYSVGRHGEAIIFLNEACKANPRDTDASLTLATWQTWFGQDAGYEATRRRLVNQAQGTDQAGTAERAAKAACLRPTADVALLTNALNLAQQAVELGKTSALLPWYQLGLGLAQYRNGQYATAEQTLSIAERTVGNDNHDIQGIARFFRAMSLFRQDRIEEARKLFSQEAAQMPPLPKDQSKPLLDGSPVSHDVLIWWLAYKEAKSVLNEPPAAKQ
jgi:WD40 repeat protein